MTRNNVAGLFQLIWGFLSSPKRNSQFLSWRTRQINARQPQDVGGGGGLGGLRNKGEEQARFFESITFEILKNNDKVVIAAIVSNRMCFTTS